MSALLVADSDRVPAGDLNALCARLMAHIQPLRRYLDRSIPARLRATVSVDDVLQQVWVAAYRGFGGFSDRGPDALDRWLTALAAAKLADCLRSARRLCRGGAHTFLAERRAAFSSCSGLFDRLASPLRTPSGAVRDAETAHCVLIALERLRGDHRRAIELHYLQGLSEREVAQQMGRSLPAVHSLLRQGRERMRRMLGAASKYFSDPGDE